MNASSTAAVTTDTLDVSDGTIYYEVRGQGQPVLLVAAPMDASSFAPLADLLAPDHLVITTDPRGIGRSRLHDPEQDCTPEQRADDLSALLTHLGVGPAVVLGSSGGAVTVLALAQEHPEQVQTVIAHEPPLQELLEDRADLRQQTEGMIASYLSGDVKGAWVQFLAAANIWMPDEAIEGVFLSNREPQVVADEHYQFAHMLRGTARWEPDLEALRSSTARIVVGIGEDSAGQLCDRASRALARALDLEPTLFPGDHIGFAEDPTAFADRLRTVLDRA
ncbi:MAG: alpha/beta hydrolase [Propionibacteriaceae bacterium]